MMDWDEIYKSGRKFEPMSLPLLKAILAQTKAESALDVGCGTGELVAMLSRQGIAKVGGFDLSEYAIEQAKKLTPSATLTVSDIANYKGSADLVIAKLVIALVDDIDKFMADFNRLIKPGGLGVIITPVTLPGIEYPSQYKSISIPATRMEAMSYPVLFNRSYLGPLGALDTYLI